MIFGLKYQIQLCIYNWYGSLCFLLQFLYIISKGNISLISKSFKKT